MTEKSQKKSRRKQVGFFAGAFDPVHDGHVAVAQSALAFCDLDIVYFLVEQQPWTDKQSVDIKHRRNMVKRAVAGLENVEHLPIRDMHFTIDSTLVKLEKEFSDDELFFILGADVFVRMNEQQWLGLQKFLRHSLIVFERASITEKDITNHAKELGIAVAILPSIHPHHSSTNVRLNSDSKQLWLPKTVSNYIEQHSLYNINV